MSIFRKNFNTKSNVNESGNSNQKENIESNIKIGNGNTMGNNSIIGSFNNIKNSSINSVGGSGKVNNSIRVENTEKVAENKGFGNLGKNNVFRGNVSNSINIEDNIDIEKLRELSKWKVNFGEGNVFKGNFVTGVNIKSKTASQENNMKSKLENNGKIDSFNNNVNSKIVHDDVCYSGDTSFKHLEICYVDEDGTEYEIEKDIKTIKITSEGAVDTYDSSKMNIKLNIKNCNSLVLVACNVIDVNGKVEVLKNISGEVNIQKSAQEIYTQNGDIFAQNIYGDAKTSNGNIQAKKIGGDAKTTVGNVRG